MVSVLAGLLLIAAAAGGVVRLGTGPADPVRGGSACAPIGFSAVGASFTQGDAWNPTGTRMHTDTVDPASWAYWTDADPRFTLEGGWALAGQMTSDVAGRVDAGWFPDDTKVVLLLGTNDAMLGADPEQIGGHLHHIVAVSGAPADDVTVVLLPPNDYAPGQVREINTELQQVAAEAGWAVVDIGTAMGDGRGFFAEGVSADGIHLTEPWARYAGETIAAAMGAHYPCP